MSDPYGELLEATLRHLRDLKAHGETHVSVSREVLAGLAGSGAQRPPAAPASLPRPAFVPPPRTAPAEKCAPVVLKPEAPPPVPAGGKAAAMEALRQRVLGCLRCAHLVTSRKNIVFGVGNLDAALMFVGEAPGADEDRQGQPFVGAAGQTLNKIITAMGLRREDVYIANILKCRPDTPGQNTGNRKPTAEEMATCVSYLQEQIAIVQPRVLVALGGTAIEGLLGNIGGISRLRGQWRVYRGIPLMPTYHPAYLLHNQSNSEKRKVWEDMLQVMEKLEMPISAKQRGFFMGK